MPVEYLERLMAYEDGTLAPQDTIDLFQDLVDSGDVWRLQGHYRRAAQKLIALGMIQQREAQP